jgi:peptidyl-prolyl cis-trans isomerase B (cyclophilin B)
VSKFGKSLMIAAVTTLLAASTVSIASASAPVTSTASSAATAKVKCTTTKAVGHQPLAVPVPKVGRTYTDKTFTIVTNCGTIVIAADGVHAPVTVQVMQALAVAGYFNNSLCHRLTTAGLYVLQCGDPTASGSGGPAFTYGNENLPAATQNNYPAGIVAMANTGQPNSNGSQFFLVYQNTTLAPSYTRWGTITKGLNIVQYIAAQGVSGGGGDGAPAQKVAIESVSVK